MSNIFLLQKRQELKEQCGLAHRRIIASIKRGLVHARLANLEKATKHLHNNASSAPHIVARLNHAIRYSPVSLRWFPGNNKRESKLLIRNDAIGLIIKSSAQGIEMNSKSNTSIPSLGPEAILTILSAQVRQ